ncbi:MAG: hypothetical protein COA79_24485 [Planctomycetota bacterium]|nr:MAG: hypothetical protein COA79_24485 [Planctomycetota bacterium]
MFSPSEKQLQAIQNMETFAGIQSHREYFDNLDEFNDYWFLVDKRCKKKNRLRSAIADGHITQKEINEKHAEKLSKYYKKKEALVDYATKYTLRYQPTEKKLRIQLLSKNNDPAIVDEVIDELPIKIDDEKIARNKIQLLISRGKNINYIRSHLYQKMISADLIKKLISELIEEGESILDEQIIYRKVEVLKRNGKSIQYIKRKLIERREDEEIVSKIIDDVFDENDEKEILKIAVEKLKLNNIEEKKIIQRLLSKGFKYSDIKQMLNRDDA